VKQPGLNDQTPWDLTELIVAAAFRLRRRFGVGLRLFAQAEACGYILGVSGMKAAPPLEETRFFLKPDANLTI
jgi:hypothetical protein